MKSGLINLLLHASAGYVISSVLDFFLPLWIACLIALLAGIGREIYGWKVSGTGFSVADLVETIMGIMLWFFLMKLNDVIGLL